jgi:hypothetical protein
MNFVISAPKLIPGKLGSCALRQHFMLNILDLAFAESKRWDKF